MVTIQKIEMEHLPALAVLYEQLTGEETNQAKLELTYQRLLQNENYEVLGAFYEGELAGSVMGIYCQDLVGECRPFMVIENVVVSSKVRRQGVGRKLMNQLEAMARSKDCSYIILVSGAERAEAHKLYESLGYNEHESVVGFRKYL
ncbi:GNAT family N-acetyltransferase [Paenibacillus sp. Marseille-Q4541]|uniref:GNAT family N-acetyltransferase n=1 Tax=Paenibacillus sp. Marseille-Q4541 TaxID=2831522 RepID=UPI001BAB8471|nr:GNAT family N-acetyltransferase [Paenibacillus sp. Marseille-Q4541]